jgi:hypothetical protein
MSEMFFILKHAHIITTVFLQGQSPAAFNLQFPTKKYSQKLFTSDSASRGMAAAGVARRLRAAAVESLLDQEVDDRPVYLRLFPNPANIVKDIQLGVLLGRQAESRARARSKTISCN